MSERGSASLLIDGIIRQTTLLIAQLSTSAGLRAPLSRIADRVFLELAGEIEAQGVGRRVAADMFGMALRTYQKRVQRLRQGQSFSERTLWEAVFDFIETKGSIGRKQILTRFARDTEDQLGAVLNDLVQSGLVYQTGRGEQAVYGATSDADRRAVRQSDELDAVSNLAWLTIYQSGPLPIEDLATRLQLTQEQAVSAVNLLVESGRVELTADGKQLQARSLMIAAEEDAGWEAAFLDHFRAVAAALANRVRLGIGAAVKPPGVGGATYSFNIHPGHPFESEVNNLLTTMREPLDKLWDQVAAYNRAHVRPESTKVIFYLGQNTLLDSESDVTVKEGES
jgi:hypothetical protein